MSGIISMQERQIRQFLSAAFQKSKGIFMFKAEIFKRAVYNVYTQKKQSISLFLLIAVFAFFITSASVIIQSVQDGLNSTQERLGADIMVVPDGYTGSLEGILLCSRPDTIYFSNDISDELGKIDGISEITSQLYIASLSASCCSVQVQIVAYDAENDFVVKPWISAEIDGGSLGMQDAAIGYLVEAQPGDEIVLYGTPLKVKSRLAQTGNGFDACVFVTLDTAREMIRKSGEKALQKLDIDSMAASCYMVRVKDKSKIENICEIIENEIDGAVTVATQDFFGAINGSINIIQIFMSLIFAVLWLIMFVILLISLYISLNNRKKEFGLYFIIGYSRAMLYYQLTLENILLTAAGGCTGIFSACVIAFSFRNLIASAVGMPYMSLSFGRILPIILVSGGLIFITCIVITFFMCRKLKKYEIAQLIKEKM